LPAFALCLSTGHEIETGFEVDDDELMLLRATGLRAQCSFCGASPVWVFVAYEQGRGLRPAASRDHFLSACGALIRSLQGQSRVRGDCNRPRHAEKSD